MEILIPLIIAGVSFAALVLALHPKTQHYNHEGWKIVKAEIERKRREEERLRKTKNGPPSV